MMTIKQKRNVALVLLALLAAIFVTGLLLSLKKYGISIEPRPLLKLVHLIVGVAVTLFFIWHVRLFYRVYNARRRRSPIFWADTTLVLLTVIGAAVTGFMKLLPVKIRAITMWHYDLGIIMTILVVIHVIYAIALRKK